MNDIEKRLWGNKKLKKLIDRACKQSAQISKAEHKWYEEMKNIKPTNHE